MEISMANVISDETIEYVGILAKLEDVYKRQELFRDRDLGEALINSLILAVLSCAFAVLIGTSGALGMSHRKRKLDDAVAYVSTLPIICLLYTSSSRIKPSSNACSIPSFIL